MLRLTPGVHAHTHEFIATAHEDQKFGLSMAGDSTEQAGLSAAEEAVAAASGYASIDLLGLHCHIGSQIFEPDGFALAAEKLLDFLAAMQAKYSIVLPELDLGGGYGIAYTPVDTPRPAAEIAQAMAAVVRSKCAELGISAPRISIEPGRAIVGSTTFTLYEVGTLKTVRVDAPAAGGRRPGTTRRKRYVPAPVCVGGRRHERQRAPGAVRRGLLGNSRLPDVGRGPAAVPSGGQTLRERRHSC